MAGLTRPGGNITGVVEQRLELTAKQLELLKEALPTVTRVAVLWDDASAHHLGSIACSSGARPPVSDAGVIENQRGGRDASHPSFVGSERVLAPLYCTLWWCDETALFSAVVAAREDMESAGDRQ